MLHIPTKLSIETTVDNTLENEGDTWNLEEHIVNIDESVTYKLEDERVVTTTFGGSNRWDSSNSGVGRGGY